MNKKAKKFNENAIDVLSFLAQYYGIVSCDLTNNKITHKNLSSLFPFLKKVSIDWALKNQELIYTGKLVFVKDCNNNCVPYMIQNEYQISDGSISLDDREYLICELVSAIEKLIQASQTSMIILENNDSIDNHIIGGKVRDVEINNEALISLNNPGGILINNPSSISTFDYIINELEDLRFACYSSNYVNALQLSKSNDIILITITDYIYITYNGKKSKAMSLIEVRNFLIKTYYPREEIITDYSCPIDDDYMFLKDYELESLLKKYRKEKNYEKYFKVRSELRRRHRQNKKENSKIRRKGRGNHD